MNIRSAIVPSLVLFVITLAGCNRECECVPENSGTAPAVSDAPRLEVRIFKFAYIDPSAVVYQGQSMIEIFAHVKSPKGGVTFENRSNTLTVTDTAVTLDQLQSIVDKLDVPAGGKVPKLSEIPVVSPLFKTAVPQVAGKWTGRWESGGHPGHGGGLNCEAIETAPGKWAATFTAEFGKTKSYEVKLEGKPGDGAVLFGGSVDLGTGDGGVFTWTGKATATEFTGKYEGGGDTGTFKMTRVSMRRGL